MQVQAIGQVLVGYKARPIAARAGSRVRGTPLDNGNRKFTLADGNAASKGAGIVVNPVVADLDKVRPAVDEDAAAALGAVGDRQPINAGGVAHKVARIRVGRVGDGERAGSAVVGSGMAVGIGIAYLEATRSWRSWRGRSEKSLGM